MEAIAFKETGLKSIVQNILRPSLPEFGKIKIGGKGEMRKSQNGKDFQPPVKFDYFVVTTIQRDTTGNFIKDDALHKVLEEKYGTDKLTRLPIRLLYNDPAMNFPSRLVCYKGKSVVCSGDGIHGNRITDSGVKQVTCPCQHSDPAYNGDLPCKINGVLSCIIEGTEKLGGVYKYRTTSFNAVNSITSSLFWIYTQTRGILAGIPLELVLCKKDGINPKTGEPVKVNFVRVEFAGDISRLLNEARAVRREEATYDRDIKLIEAQATTIIENNLNEEIIEPEEFYPEQQTIETDASTDPTTDLTETLTADADFEMQPVEQKNEVKPQVEEQPKKKAKAAVKPEPEPEPTEPAPVADDVEDDDPF